MYYDDSIIEEVRSRNDILDVVSQVVHLEKRGVNYFGLCPFHNERTPSFSVTPAKQIFYCFGCNKGGDVFTFVREYDNLTYPEAIRQLAERGGVTLPAETVTPGAAKMRDKRRILFEINKEAATWFFGQLRAERGKTAMAYLEKRGVNKEMRRAFGLGYAPLSRDALVTYLRAKGYSDRDLTDAGVAVHDEKTGLRDRFWNRVMFPIMDVRERVIGFGGRVFGDGEPKYLNSPETMIFDKGRNLYGLMRAKNARAGRIILCEGYLDVIAMHQAGFSEAVASLGTAFTPGQAAILKRYTDEVILAYDSDGAGVRAALRGAAILREAGLKGKVLTMSPHKDPDEFIRAEGKEAFEERIRKADNPFYFEIRMLQRDYAMEDPEDRTRFQKEIAARLCERFPEPLERENYLQAVCSEFAIAPNDMKEMVVRMASSGIRSRRAEEEAREAARAEADRNRRVRKDPVLHAQKMLLTWLSDEPSLFPVVSRHLQPSDFTDPLYEKVAEAMYADLAQGSFLPARLMSRFPAEEDQRRISELFLTPMRDNENEEQKARALQDLIYDVMKSAYEQRMARDEEAGTIDLKKTIEGKQKLEQFRKTRLDLS